MAKSRAAASGVVLLTILLAGCAGSPSGSHNSPVPLPSLVWPVLGVETTHEEPEPQRGDLLVVWDGARFGISAPGESDLAARSVLVGATLYTTNQDLGWVRQEREEAVGSGQASTRYYLWDVKGLLTTPGVETQVVQEGGVTNITARGTLRLGTYELVFMVHVEAVDGAVVRAYVASPQGRESPFHFRPTTYDFPYRLEAPENARSPSEVQAGDAVARDRHAFLIGLIQAYARNHGGALPESVDPQTLSLELLAAGQSWPKNPYSQEDMADRRASGDLGWDRCSLSDGRYQGLGWDGPLLTKSFGASCR